MFDTAPIKLFQDTDPGLATAVVSWTVTVSDNSGISPTVFSDHQSGDTFELGLTPVSYTAVDASGNKASYSFEVVVKGLLIYTYFLFKGRFKNETHLRCE